MDLEKIIEDIKSEAAARKRFLRSFAEEIDDLIIRVLVANPHLLTNDIHNFLFVYALTDLSRQNLRKTGKHCIKESMEREKADLILFAQNAAKARKNEIPLLAPCVKWMFSLLCNYEKHLKEK